MIRFYALLSLLWFLVFLVLLQKIIWVIIIFVYSTILMSYYLEDTLANVGLPEAWLEFESNYMTQIKNNCVKRSFLTLFCSKLPRAKGFDVSTNRTSGNGPIHPQTLLLSYHKVLRLIQKPNSLVLLMPLWLHIS